MLQVLGLDRQEGMMVMDKDEVVRAYVFLTMDNIYSKAIVT